jgi:LmbE family N-acetylglucosaminyl deacetylase
MENEYLPRIAMSIHAHPDDQEFSAAGTLAKWAQAGCRVISVIVTSGDAGSNDPAHGAEYKPKLAELREAEQLAANALLGIAETVFLRYPDGVLEPTLDLRRDLTRLIRRFQPEVVMAGNMEAAFYGNDYINHPDHRAAAEAAVYAVFPSAGTRLIFPELLAEGLEPHTVKRLYIHGTEAVDTWVDISAQIELKLEALRKHISQFDEAPTEEVRKWDAEAGKARGVEYAESFRVMVLVKEDQG